MADLSGTLFDLRGKVAVVTGASRGIGRAIAIQLARHGASVVVSSRRLAACEAVVADILADGGRAAALTCDVRDYAQVEALVEQTLASWSGIDILVCNAAINPFHGPSAAMPEDVFDLILTTNVKRIVQMSNLVLPQMAERGGGVVLVVSSLGGLQGTDSLGAYNISKAAEMQVVRNIAVEWGPYGVRANCLAPGLIRTDFSRALWQNRGSAYTQAIAQNPIQRIGEPDDVAGLAVCLASDAGAFITGQTIAIDGGKLIGRLPLPATDAADASDG